MTATVSSTPARPDRAPFRHELYPYRGEDQYLSGTLDYIHEALEADEAVVVAVPSDKTSLLRGELADETAVTFVDTTTAGPDPGRYIAAWSAWMNERGEGGRPVRGIGETAWRQARSAAHLSELRYHEWLMNRAFARSSTWSMLCPYDAADEDQDALRSLSRCHPQIRRDGRHAPNEDYLTGGEYSFDALAAPCDPFQELSYTHGDLAAIRSKVSPCAADAGVPEDRLPKLAVSVTEIATNSIRHGGGHGTLRTWVQNATFLCEFRDSGYIPDAMTGRIRPEANQIGGRGLWLAHQLCDLVEIRSTPDRGTTIRLHVDAPQRGECLFGPAEGGRQVGDDGAPPRQVRREIGHVFYSMSECSPPPERTPMDTPAPPRPTLAALWQVILTDCQVILTGVVGRLSVRSAYGKLARDRGPRDPERPGHPCDQGIP